MSSPDTHDDEYELEAPDESIVDLAKQRTQERLADAQEELAIEDAQRSMEERQSLDTDDFKFQFRFQVKHLLILTTVLSLLLAVRQFFNLDMFAILLVVTMFALLGIHTFLSWKEHKRLEEASARRAAAVRRIRQRQAERALGESNTMYDEPLEEDPADADQEFAEAADDKRFLPSYSLRDLMIGITVAAVLMGLGAVMGAQAMAVMLALVAVSGLVAFGVGLKPPPVVVTIWWMTLACYILLSFAKAFGIIGAE